MVKQTTNILNYVIDWRSISLSGFIGELFFIVHNSSGGSLSTPVGYIVGFKEPASEYSAVYWRILIIVRDKIRYDMLHKNTYVFTKSAYANKIKYHIQKLTEFNQEIIRIDPQLSEALKDELIRAEMCNSPLTVQTIAGDDKYVYSNVQFEFD